MYIAILMCEGSRWANNMSRQECNTFISKISIVHEWSPRARKSLFLRDLRVRCSRHAAELPFHDICRIVFRIILASKVTCDETDLVVCR